MTTAHHAPPDGPPSHDSTRASAAGTADEAHCRNLIELIPHLTWRAPPDGSGAHFSSRWTTLTGLPMEAAMNGGWQEAQHPDDLPGMLEARAYSLQSGAPFDVRHRMRTADGSYRWMRSQGSALRDAESAVVQWYGITEDIHDLVIAEEALAESERSFRTLANATPQLTWISDNQMRIIWYNDRFGELTDVGPGSDPSAWKTLYHPDHVERVMTHLIDCFDKGVPWEDTFPFRLKDGSYRWCLGRAVPVRIDGAVVKWFGTGTDITELIEAKNALAAANEAKTRLVSAVSHDLRQPLQSLALFAAVIAADPGLSEKSRTALRHLRSSVDGMGQLLGSVLELAKTELGLVDGRKQAVALAPLLRRVEAEMRPQAEAKGLRLRRIDCSAVVDSDPVLLTTILRNLLANAIRYTERGGVLIGCRRRGAQVLICIHDTGKGIESDKLKLVFEEFYQVGNDARDSRQGLGLGLSIVERLSRQLGHKVSVQSESRKGSTFAVLVDRAG